MKNNIILFIIIYFFISNTGFGQCRLKIDNFDPTTACDYIVGSASVDIDFCTGNKKFVKVFEDDFNGPTIDDFFWNSGGDEERGGWKCYTSYFNNLEFDNGVMKIITRKEPGYHRRVQYAGDDELVGDDQKPNLRLYEYTTGRIRSNKEFQYGIFEIRAKIPIPGSGLWPAFWMFGYAPQYGNHHELDIFESNDESPDGPFLTTHMWYKSGAHEFCMNDLNCQQDFYNSFHTITAIWDPGAIDWYIDGQNVLHISRMYDESKREICHLDAPQIGIFNQVFPYCPMSLIANSDAYKDRDSFPSFDIDYIKIWQRFDIVDKTVYQSNISTELYNVEVGRNITIDGNVSISNKNQLKVIASNGITINPGFSVEPGSEFEATIDNSIE